MLGGLLFAYVASPHFDSHVKEFRLFADVINDVALTLDMLTPLLRHHNHLMMWTISAISMLCKVMCGMSAGATKASITVHLAKR
jgi:hypothetical protein